MIDHEDLLSRSNGLVPFNNYVTLENWTDLCHGDPSVFVPHGNHRFPIRQLADYINC